MAEDQLAEYRRRMEAKRGGRPAPVEAQNVVNDQRGSATSLLFGGSEYQREARRPLLGSRDEDWLPKTEDKCCGFSTQMLVLGAASGLACGIVCLLLATLLMDS